MPVVRALGRAMAIVAGRPQRGVVAAANAVGSPEVCTGRGRAFAGDALAAPGRIAPRRGGRVDRSCRLLPMDLALAAIPPDTGRSPDGGTGLWLGGRPAALPGRKLPGATARFDAAGNRTSRQNHGVFRFAMKAAGCEFKLSGHPSEAARARMLATRWEPLFLAAWQRVLMVHFEVEAGLLQSDGPSRWTSGTDGRLSASSCLRCAE